ncbi:hypothetical protein [Sphingopyxis chilensis]
MAPKNERRTARPRAIVWLADPKHWEAANYIQDNFEWRIDAFRSEDLDAFREQAQSSGANAFAVLRQSAPGESMSEIVFAERNVTAIEFGSLRQLQARGLDLLTPHRRGGRIYVPSTGLPGTGQSPKTMARTVRQVIAAVATIERDDAGQIDQGSWAFLRAKGTGNNPAIDCWATLYDRAWQAGVETNLSYQLAGTGRKGRDDREISDHYAQMLFPTARPVRDHWVDAEMRNSRIDGAILCFGDRRFGTDLEKHGAIVRSILADRGWAPKGIERDSTSTLEVSPIGSLHRVDVQPPESLRQPVWQLHEMMGGVLRSIKTVTISSDAK